MTDGAAIPSETTTACWSQLVRLPRTLLAAVEADLKAAGFPPLAWHEALLELARAPDGKLRPIDLERAMTLPQYSTSRLIERLVRSGLACREACPVDGRGQVIVITTEGRDLQARMWKAYGTALARHVEARLSQRETAQLRDLLAKLV